MVNSEHFESLLADTDVVLDQEINELVAVNECDRRGPAFKRGFLGTFRELGSRNDGSSDSVEPVE